MKLTAALVLVWAGAAGGAFGLSVDGLGLHKFDDGPLLDSSYQFLPGEMAHFSCRFAEYHTQDDTPETRLAKVSWTMEVRDPSGVLLEPAAQGKIDATLFEQDKSWKPKFLHDFTVPAFALSGEYTVAVHGHDEIGNADVAGVLKFRVKGHDLQPSPELAVRNFLFLKSEDDAFGVHQGFYKPGQKIWARMDVTGYKFGDKNRFSISFGMAVLGPDGHQIFAQPDAGKESDESFYPQSYAPGMLTVTLDPGSPLGTYTLVVTVKDEVGNQTAEVREPFQLQ